MARRKNVNGTIGNQTSNQQANSLAGLHFYGAISGRLHPHGREVSSSEPIARNATSLLGRGVTDHFHKVDTILSLGGCSLVYIEFVLATTPKCAARSLSRHVQPSL